MSNRGESTDPREVIEHLQLSLSEAITARVASERKLADVEKALDAARGQLSMRSGYGWLPPEAVGEALADLRARCLELAMSPWRAADVPRTGEEWVAWAHGVASARETMQHAIRALPLRREQTGGGE